MCSGVAILVLDCRRLDTAPVLHPADRHARDALVLGSWSPTDGRPLHVRDYNHNSTVRDRDRTLYVHVCRSRSGLSMPHGRAVCTSEGALSYIALAIYTCEGRLKRPPHHCPNHKTATPLSHPQHSANVNRDWRPVHVPRRVGLVGLRHSHKGCRAMHAPLKRWVGECNTNNGHSPNDALNAML